MSFEFDLLIAGALCCVAVALPAAAQTVYKCGSAAAPTYSDQPCSNHIVNTDEAAVPVKPDASRAEQHRLIAQSMRRLPGESAADFESRRRRAGLREEDRAECARLDKRMPVEQAGMNNADKDEAVSFGAALQRSRKRFVELRC